MNCKEKNEKLDLSNKLVKDMVDYLSAEKEVKKSNESGRKDADTGKDSEGS